MDAHDSADTSRDADSFVFAIEARFAGIDVLVTPGLAEEIAAAQSAARESNQAEDGE